MQRQQNIRMVRVSPAEFLMGSDKDDEFGDEREQPRHVVKLSEFEISANLITVGQWRRFLDESGYDWGSADAASQEEQREWVRFTRSPILSSRLRTRFRTNELFEIVAVVSPSEDHPMVYVSWFDCMAFARWLTTDAGGRWCLPTEAQWEYVCCGPESKLSPWGTTMPDYAGALETYATMTGTTELLRLPVHVPVNAESVGQSWCGCRGMWQIVAEWCYDRFEEGYPVADKMPVDPTGAKVGTNRVFRGGNPTSGGWPRCAHRGFTLPHFRNFDLGFRVVRMP